MRRDRVIPGWSRIGEVGFKAAIMAAAKTEPDLCERLRHAIKATAARRGVRRDLRDQYLGWITEAEGVIRTLNDAECRQAEASVPSPH